MLLHPQYMGPNMRMLLLRRLYSEVEGRTKDILGIVIMVAHIDSVRARIRARAAVVGCCAADAGPALVGSADRRGPHPPRPWLCILRDPLPGHHVPAVPRRGARRHGHGHQRGTQRAAASPHRPHPRRTNGGAPQFGVFLAYGPIEVFVPMSDFSSHVKRYALDRTSVPPLLRSADDDSVITKNTKVRVRIQGVRIEATGIVRAAARLAAAADSASAHAAPTHARAVQTAIASIVDNFLGTRPRAAVSAG